MLSRSGNFYVTARAMRNRLINTRLRLAADATVAIHPTSQVSRDLITEEYVFIGRNCTIGPRTTIGRYSMLASAVAIVGDDHPIDRTDVPAQFAGRPDLRPTSVGRDVWIGHGSIILAGVRIGDGAVVGAGSVVTSDIPPREIWVGTPARRMRRRFDSTRLDDQHEVMLSGRVQPPSFAERR